MPDWYQINKEASRGFLAESRQDRLVDSVLDFPIPKAMALQLCAEIRRQRAKRWYLPRAWLCSMCVSMAQDGIPARMVRSRPGCYGCPAVKKLYLQTHAGS